MAEKMQTGITANDLRAAFEDFQSAPSKQTKTIEYIVDDKGGTSELTQEMKNLNAELQKFAKLNQVQRSSLKWFGSQEKMVNNLKKSWNEYAMAVKNGIVNGSGEILVSKDNKDAYKQARSVRANLMSSYNAANIAIGVDNIDISEIPESIRKEIQQVVSSLKLTDSFKNYSLSEEKLEPVLESFSSISKAAEDAGLTVEDAFEKMGIAFRNAFDDIKINDLSSIFDSATSSAGDTSDKAEKQVKAAEESAQRTEDAVEREQKALESLEQIKRRAQSNKNKTYTFYDDYDFNQRMYHDEDSSNGYGSSRWVDIDGQDLEAYQKALQKLKDLQDESLQLAKSYQNQYADAYNSGNDSQAQDFLRQMQEEIDYYNKYADAIEYVQSKITDKAINFKPGEEWGEDEIKNLIQLIQMLVQEVQKVTTAFGQIDNESAAQPLLTQFSDLAIEISHIALELTNLKSALRGLDLSLTINAGGNNAMVQHTLLTNAKRNALDLQKDYFNAIDDYLSNNGNTDIFVGKGDLGAKFYNIASQINTKSVSQSLYAYEKLVEIMKKAAKLDGIDISPIEDEFEPKIEAANHEMEKYINTEEEAAKSADRIKHMFGTLNVQSPISVDQIDEITDALVKLQKVLQAGLGISELEDESSTSYLSRINDSINDIVESFSKLSQIINDIDFGKIQTAKNDIRDVLVFRGTNGDDPFTSNSSGMTFWHSTKSEARRYGTNGEDKTLYSGLLSISNPLEVDAAGSNYHDINYLGDGSDSISKQLIELTDHAEECRQELLKLQQANEDDMVSMQRAAQVGLDYSDTLKKIKEISEDDSNPYGKHNTDWFAEFAQRHGYDGLHVKNVIDNPDALTDGGNVGDIYVTFGKQQVKDIQLLEKGNKKVLSSSNETQKAAESAADAIAAEGDAATIAAKKKEEFAKANEKVAETATETKKETSKAAESIKKEGDATTAEHEHEKQSGIFINQTDYQNGDYSYTKYLGYAQREMSRVHFDDEGAMTTITTTRENYRQLENEIIKADELVLKLNDDLTHGLEEGRPVQAIEDMLDVVEERYHRLTEELERYYNEAQFLPDDEQVQDFARRRREAAEYVMGQIQNKNDTNTFNEENKRATRQAQEEARQMEKEELQAQKELNKAREEGRKQTEQIYKEQQKQLDQQRIFDDKQAEAEKKRNAEREKNNQAYIDKWKDSQNKDTSAGTYAKTYEQNLRAIQNMKKDADAAQESMREIFKMMRSGDISKDQYASALSTFRQQKSNLRDNDISNFYKEITDAADKYIEARNKMNELEAKRISSGNDDITHTREWAEAVKQLQDAYQNAETARKKLSAIKDDISDDQYKDAIEKLDKGDLGSAQSLDKIEAAQRKRTEAELGAIAKQDASDYKEYIRIIEEATTARDKVNENLIQEMSGKNIVSAADDMRDLTTKADAAADAIKRVFEMLQHGKITNALADEAGNKYVTSLIGKNAGKVEQARQDDMDKKRKQEVKSQIDAYNDNLKTYESLYKKQVNSALGKGVFGTQDVKEMQEIETKLADQINQWGDAIKNGDANLALVIADLKDIYSIQSDINKTSIDKSLGTVENKFASLRRQSSWRTGDWQSEVDSLEIKFENIKQQAESIKISGDVSGLKQINDELETLLTEIMQVQKSTDFRPVRAEFIDQSLADVSKWMDQNKKAAKAFKNELLDLWDEIQRVESETDASNVKSKFARIQAKAADQGLLGKSLGDRFKEQFKNTMTSLSTYYLSFQDFLRYGREAITIVKEYDDALTQMRMVSTESLSTLKEYQLSTFETAKQVGSTAVELQQSTAQWMRLGKSMEEAGEASKASAWLVNVSEFESIDEATTSLVSMKQAFQDLGYEDFIDKLNGVGDSFSSSTSDLAQGMQNVSAVLKTAGNDIDQSLALLTAANDITQDMSKASMGVRTVALRIAGTEAAKEELEELGEDVSDFVVQTSSKVDSQVRRMTATAANPQGVSVLDDRGRLRSTFDILTDISAVYDDIVKKDNQYGTNTSNALLELLAGKTRSNILASILQNPELLQNAYKRSQNSEGVGQKELDAYLDSLSAKVSQFQNQLQELATVTIDSQWLKTLVDLGTQFLGITTAIVKNLGSINVIGGLVGGLLSSRTGLGVLGYSQGSGFSLFPGKTKTNNTNTNTNSNKLTPAERLFGYINPKRTVGGAAQQTAQKFQNNKGVSVPSVFVDHTDTEQVVADGTQSQYNESEAIRLSMQKTMDGGKPIPLDVPVDADATVVNSDVDTVVVAMNDLDNYIEDTQDMWVNYGNSAQSAAQANEEFAQSSEAISGGIRTVATASREAGGAMSTLQSIGGTLASTFVNIGVSMLASFAFTKLIEGFVYLLTYTDKIIEKGQKAKESIDSIFEESKTKQDAIKNIGKSVLGTEDDVSTDKSIDAIAEKYDKLHDSVNNFTNENVSLTNEDYSEYLSLCNQIAEQFPSLVKGYDEQGNAILNLGNSADTARTKMSELLAAQQLSANYEIANNLSDMWKGMTTAVTRYEEEAEQAEAQANYLRGLSTTPKLEYGHNYIETDFANAEAVIKLMNNTPAWAGSYIYNGYLTPDENDNTVKLYFDGLENASREAVSEINQNLQNIGIDLGFDIAALEQKKRDAQLMIEDQWASIGDSAGKYLQTSKSFVTVDKALQNAIIGNIQDIDTSKIGTEYKDILSFIYGEIISPLSELSQESQKELSEIFDIRMDNKSIEDYKTQIMNSLSEAFGDDAGDFYKLFGFENTVSEIEKSRKNILNTMIKNRVSMSSEDMAGLMGMSIEEIQIGAEVIKNRVYDSWDELYEAIQKKLKEKPREVAKEGVLSDIFGDDTYKENVETYEKNLTSLSTALQSLRTDGKLTAEAMRDLQESFPNLTDFSQDSLQKAASDELGKWISDTAKGWKDLTPEGLKQLDTYVQNLAMSYGDLGISADKAKDAVVQSIYNGLNANGMAGSEASLIQQAAEESYKQIRGRLESLHPEGLNEEVVWMLALEDRFSDPAADIYAEYDGAVMKWDIQVDMAKTKEDIEKNLQDISAERAKVQADGALREAMGLDADNYDELLRLDDEEIEQYENAVENTYEAMLEEAQKELDEANEDIQNAWSIGAQIEAGKRAEEAQAKIDYITDNKKTIDTDNLEAQANLANSQAQEIQDKFAKQHSSIDKLNTELSKLQNSAQVTQNELTQLQNAGLKGTETQYKTLIENADGQISVLQQQQSKLSGIILDRMKNIDDYANSEQYVTDFKEYLEIIQQIVDLQNSQQEWELQPLTDQLTEYQDAYTTMQTQAEKCQREITKAETDHQKVSEDTYNRLISNGNNQIKNMEQQKSTLVDLQRKVVEGSDKWLDYQSQIDSLDSSIFDLQNSQVDWFETMTSLVSTNASALSSTLSSAFEEINSETGLTIDTMNELERQFSDLSGKDISGIFYQSADGMKMNVRAAEELVDAEYKLQTSELYDTISQQKSIIEKYGASEDETAKKAVDAANKRIDAANRELSMLQALYDQQKQQFSGYDKWQTAQNTDNAGKHYEDLYSYLETQTENREKGLTGTDEFRAYTEYFSQWGLDTTAEWDRVKDKVQRYLTEDFNGMYNFLEDMVSKGLMGKDADGMYSQQFDDFEKAAQDMGMSLEWFRDMLSRGEDYGAISVWVESTNDGMNQMEEATENLLEAQLELNQARREGASQEIIDNAQAVVDEFVQQIEDIDAATQKVQAAEGKITSTELKNAIADIETFKKLRDEALESGNEQEAEHIFEYIQDYADAHYIKLTPELEVDEEAMQKDFPDTIKVNSVLLPNGIDLTKRPRISPEDMRAAGYDVADDEYATVYSGFVTNEDNTQALVYTPILPDGRVLDAETAEQYANEALQGVEPPEAITLKMFEGEDAFTQAQNYSDVLHLVQEAYYDNEEGFNELVSTIQKYDGDALSQIIFGDNEYNGEPELEKSLDQMLEYFNLGQDKGNALIEVLKQMFALSTENEEVVYDIPKPDEIVTPQGLRDEYISRFAGENAEKVAASLFDFDEADMEIDKLEERLEKLYKLRDSVARTFSDESRQELNTLIDQTQQKTFALKTEGTTFDADTYLAEGTNQQEYLQSVGIVIDDSEYEAFRQYAETQTIDAKVHAVMEGNNLSADDLSGMSDEELIQIGFDESSLDAVKSSIEAIKTEAETITIRISDDQFEALTSSDISVGANTEEAKEGIEEAKQMADETTGTMKVKADTSPAIADANLAVSNINAMNAVVSVDANTSKIANAIDIELSKPRTTTITARIVKTGEGVSSLGGQANISGTALASGTGNVPTPHKGTLVGEEGYEIHVSRDNNQWEVVGQNGPEFRDDIKPGDVVFNHQQSEDLLEHGHTSTHGKAMLGGDAYSSGSYKIGAQNTHDGGAAAKAQNDNTKAVKDNTKSTKKDTNQKKKSTKHLDRFQKWLGKLFDWIQVRYQRNDEKIEKYETKSDLKTTYQNKNADLATAMATNLSYQDDAKAGAKRYQKQAKNVYKKATSGKTKIVSKKNAKNLISKIKSGKISIESLTSKEKAFVDEYTKWYDLAVQSQQKMLELQQKYKELEQEKLDNITAQFEILQKYAESVQAVSDSYINLNTVNGKQAVNSSDIKSQYNNQMAQQNYTTGYLRAELKAYDAEMKKAREVFGENSNEYHNAMIKREEILSSIYESESKYYELRKKQAETEFTAISNVMDRINGIVSLVNSRISLLQKRDNNYTEAGSADVDTFINPNNGLYYGLLASNNTLIEEYKKQWDEAVKYIGENQLTVENNDEYMDYYNRAIKAETEIENLLASQEDIKKNIRDLRWKGFEDLQKQIKETISDFDHLRDIMREAEFFDWEYGIEITDEGYANLALLAENINNARQQVVDYRKALEKLDTDYKNGNITETEYNDTTRDFIETIQDAAKAASSYEDAIVSMYTSQVQAETDFLTKNINARKEALNAKKAYYDYDKNIKSKTKDITQIQAQIAALENSANAGAKAQLAKLQSQLKDAQDDLADTQYQHEIEVQQTGYDKVIEDATKVLEDTLKKIEADQATRNETIAYELGLLNGHSGEASAAIQKKMEDTGTVIGNKAQSIIETSLSSDDKLSQMLNMVLDTSWQTDIPSAVKDIVTDVIKTSNENTESIETDINKDITSLILPSIKTGGILDKNGQTTNTRLKSIQTALEKFKSSYDAANKTKEQQEKQGENSGNSNKVVGGDTGKAATAASGNTSATTTTTTTTTSTKSDNANALKVSTISKTLKKGDKGEDVKTLQTVLKKLNYKGKNGKTLKVDGDFGENTDRAVKKFQSNHKLTQDGKVGPKTKAEFKKLGYRKGSKSTDDELNWLHDSEVIIRKSDGAILQPFNSGDMVFTSKQSKNLWEMSQIPMETIQEMVAHPDMSKYKQVGISDKFVSGGNTTQNIHFDSLITINGNADQQTVNDIKEIAQALVSNRNFQQNVTKFITRDFTREGKKLGYRQ